MGGALYNYLPPMKFLSDNTHVFVPLALLSQLVGSNREMSSAAITEPQHSKNEETSYSRPPHLRRYSSIH